MAYTYQRSNYGDYYQGDIFGTILGGIKKVAGVAGSLIPGPVGTVARVLTGSSGQRAPAPPPVPVSPGGLAPGAQVVPTPGVRGALQRLVPGGATGYEIVGKKRRRMNVTNDKALRRAIRREQGFVKLARKALQGTGYRVVSKSSIGRRSPGVITRSEAARALRK